MNEKELLEGGMLRDPREEGKAGSTAVGAG